MAGGVKPARTCRIKGIRYELLATGSRRELWDEFATLMRAAPPRIIGGHTFAWTEYSSSDGGAPYILKAASADQCDKWVELGAYKNLDRVQRYHANACLLWKRVG